RIAHCPKSNAKFAHGIAPLQKFKQAGINVGLGSDSVASNNTCDLIEEARFASLLHRSIARSAEIFTPEEMLRMMTIDGARALRMESMIGSLEANKQADLVVIDLSHTHTTPHYDPMATIIWSCSARDVKLTMVKGQVIYDGLRVMTIDEAAIQKSIATIQSKLSVA
ncbi:MAG TPA: amidohydrolase family protein, partial [Blastocatellia bacterium]|nr:amidohydrolase family protein [Blastocatellia bacterium]